MTWIEAWKDTFGISSEVPLGVVAFGAVFCLYFFVVLASSIIFNFLDHKITADLQARVGPNRAGPKGIFHFLADFLKLMEKGITRKKGAPNWLWFSLHSMALYSTIAALPIGADLVLLNTDMSALVPVWTFIVLALGLMLLGLEQRTVSGGFGGLRLAAQVLAGSFPSTVAILCVGFKSGGLKWTQIVDAQGAYPHHWTAFSDPFSFIAFCVFLCGGLILLSVPPFDAALGPSELAGGISSQEAGRRLSLFWFGRFYGFFFWSMMTAALFLGGWRAPEAVTEIARGVAGPWLYRALEAGVIVSKAFFVMLSWVVVSRVVPRLRSDQITGFAWKILCPFALVALAGVSIWISFVGIGS